MERKMNLIVIGVLFSSISTSVDSKMNNYFLDINDIMSDKLMPMSLIMLEGSGPSNENTKNDSVDSLESGFQCATKNLQDDGTINTAFSTMGFHRFDNE